MTGHLTLPPKIIDQSFPRDQRELKKIAYCIGEIVDCCRSNGAIMLLTDLFSDHLDSFAWNDQPGQNALLNDIHVSLMSLASLQNGACIKVDLSSVTDSVPHPLPEGYDPTGDAGVWQEDMGRLLRAHDATNDAGGFYIGVACDKAFFEEKADPQNCNGLRAFPFVGAKQLDSLLSGYRWLIPPGSIDTPVTFKMAKANLKLIGATKITKPRGGGSHYQVKFAGGRTWPLDYNTDPVPKRFLDELAPITGLPVEVIIYVLLHKDFPPKELRLRKYIVGGQEMPTE